MARRTCSIVLMHDPSLQPLFDKVVATLQKLESARSTWQMDPSGCRVTAAGGGYFLYIFSGFAIDRSKKYIKTIKNHMKIDGVDP